MAVEFRGRTLCDGEASDILLKESDSNHAIKNNKFHIVSLKYPPGPVEIAHVRILDNFKSFIHELFVHCSSGDVSVQQLFSSLVPDGCRVQTLRVEYAVETSVSLSNIGRLAEGSVSSVTVKLLSIKLIDVRSALAAVKFNKGFAVKLCGWHEITPNHILFLKDRVTNMRSPSQSPSTSPSQSTSTSTSPSTSQTSNLNFGIPESNSKLEDTIALPSRHRDGRVDGVDDGIRYEIGPCKIIVWSDESF